MELGVLRCLRDGAGGAGEGDEVQAYEFCRDPPPGAAGLALGDVDEQQREPGEQDVRADAVLESVEDRPQLDRGLGVAEAALGLEQVPLAERDVLGAGRGRWWRAGAQPSVVAVAARTRRQFHQARAIGARPVRSAA